MAQNSCIFSTLCRCLGIENLPSFTDLDLDLLNISIMPTWAYLSRTVWELHTTKDSFIYWYYLTDPKQLVYEPRQANLVLIAYGSSEGSGEPAHPRSLTRTSTARSYKQWVKRNLQTESQIPGPSEWLGMRS